MMLVTSWIDRQATIAMVIIAVFWLEVIRVLVKKDLAGRQRGSASMPAAPLYLEPG